MSERKEFVEHIIPLIARELNKELPMTAPKVRLLLETRFLVDALIDHVVARIVDVREK